MVKIKTIFKFIIILSLIIFATPMLISTIFFCIIPAIDDKITENKTIEKANTISVAYAKEKYGINVSIENSECLQDDNGFIPRTQNTDWADITVNYQSEKFIIRVDTDSNKCYDNRYLDKMNDDLNTYLCNKLNIEKPTRFNISFGTSIGGFVNHKDEPTGLVDFVYDGDISVLLNKISSLRITYDYIDIQNFNMENFSAEGLFNYLNKCGIKYIEMNLINYRTQNDFDQVKKVSPDELDEQASHIKEAKTCSISDPLKYKNKYTNYMH